jgi:hypothetical protein
MTRLLARALLLGLFFIPACAGAQAQPALMLEGNVGGVNVVGGDYYSSSILLVRGALAVQMVSKSRVQPLALVGFEGTRTSLGHQVAVSQPTCIINVDVCGSGSFFPGLLGWTAAAGVDVRFGTRYDVRPTVGGGWYRGANGVYLGAPAGGLAAGVQLPWRFSVLAESRIMPARFRGSSIQVRSLTIGIRVR